MSSRQAFAAALASLWLLACGGTQEASPEVAFASARAFNPLTACETTNFGRFARSTECPGAHLVFISREASPDAIRERARVAYAAFGYEPDMRSLLVNGREEPTLTVLMGPPDKPEVGVSLTAFAVPGTSESIEVQCLARAGYADPKRCSSLLDAFVAQGLLRGEWPRVLSSMDPQVHVLFDAAGREIKLPSSCDELGPYDVDCKDGHLRMYFANDAAQLSRMQSAELTRTASPTIEREWTAPCLLEGVATECTLRRYPLPFHDELYTFTATATVRERPILLACDVKKTRAQLLPGAICGQVLSFEESAFEDPPPEEMTP